MRRPFKSFRDGIQVHLDQDERDIVVQLLGQLDELLDDGQEASADPLAALVGLSGIDGPGSAPSPPEDPAVARLLPEGNRDDAEVATEYRRLTEFGLRARKRSGARLAAAALARPEPVLLDTEEALALMKAFTDIRLVLGERLELRTDEDSEKLHERLWAGDGDPSWLATASVYELLTVWQEHLIEAVAKHR